MQTTAPTDRTAEIDAQRDRAADFIHAWASQFPASRFIDVDGTPENALMQVTPEEIQTLVAAAMAAVVHSIEALPTRTEYAVGDPDDCATDDDVREVPSPAHLTVTDRDYGRKLLQRSAYLTPWAEARSR